VSRVVLGGLVWIATEVLLTVTIAVSWAKGMEKAGISDPAQAASPVDGNVGMSMAGLFSSLGAVVAVVVVTSSFLCFLQKQRLERTQLLERFRSCQSESQQRFQKELERLVDRHELVQKKFQDQVDRIIEGQNAILHEMIGAMRFIEESLGSSGALVQGILQAVDSLPRAISGLNILVHRTTGGVMVRPAEEKPS